MNRSVVFVARPAIGLFSRPEGSVKSSHPSGAQNCYQKSPAPLDLPRKTMITHPNESLSSGAMITGCDHLRPRVIFPRNDFWSVWQRSCCGSAGASPVHPLR